MTGERPAAHPGDDRANGTPEVASASIGGHPHPLPHHRRNGFDVLRVFAAVLVIFGHAYPLNQANAPVVLGNGVQAIGVKIFFVISGYLITSSWRNDSHLIRYVMRRVLRIMPGLIAAVVFCAIPLGLAFTELPWTTYLANGGVYRYLRNILLFPVYDLPGVFRANLYPVAVNGSLWSLPAEVAMYVMVPILIGFDRARERMLLPLFTVFMVVGCIYVVRIAPPAVHPVVYGTDLVSLLDVAVYFYLGALWAAFGLDRMNRPFAAVLLLAGAAYCAREGIFGEVGLLLFLPAAVIAVGCLHIPSWYRITRGADVSYGLYLYGFPMQQACVALFGDRLGPLGNFAVSLPPTLLLAIASWYLIEKPILMRKPVRNPRRLSGG